MSPRQVKVRLRHQWVALITMPLTEEQAATMAAGGWESLKLRGDKAVSYGGPVCWRCEQGWEEQAYSCPSTPSGSTQSRLPHSDVPAP